MPLIYDFMPVSLSDYPGVVACTVFLPGCNFRCPYCHNGPLVKQCIGGKVSESILFEYLEKRRNLVDGVCITGGEPTLWSDLGEFLKELKNRGLKVKLDTNGSQPEIVKELIQKGLVDYVAVDIKASPEKYSLFTKYKEHIEGVLKTVELVKTSSVDYEFRTTVHERILSLEDIKAIARWLSGAKRYVLQGYRYSEGVIDPEFCGKKPCDKAFLERAKEEISEYFGEIVIRS
ncbi:pyruvate formate lyase activating enzyme [Caldanaerovirga acetigignens]|jgi:pyruvate formate lyase activating enzyme|uniref:Pyruvate formate lyase activating enzyme n=1 Tax=Caldanaerovirga acetigignens TaxID=447595 RepID=A0A1M7KPG3_9FIRM|nr:anaerobic ribonucleoside-triphosphate reductase activating protein [Caldanaerovirga acetigignens]SHM66878.1 pyruvate formate lyase activating enzyme [Caldanaerovirga acetigignens]